MQYDEWVSALQAIDIYPETRADKIKSTTTVDPTYQLIEKRERYLRRIELVNESVKIAGGEISEILLKAVTKGLSYASLEASGAPFGRDYFYERYRKFFFILDQIRD